jgi:hypothetical protein
MALFRNKSKVGQINPIQPDEDQALFDDAQSIVKKKNMGTAGIGSQITPAQMNVVNQGKVPNTAVNAGFSSMPTISKPDTGLASTPPTGKSSFVRSPAAVAFDQDRMAKIPTKSSFVRSPAAIAFDQARNDKEPPIQPASDGDVVEPSKALKGDLDGDGILSARESALLLLDTGDLDSARADRETQLDAESADMIKSIIARTGIAGMGLTGAAGALESGTRSQAARNKSITLDDLDRKNREEQRKRILDATGVLLSDEELGLKKEGLGLDRQRFEQDRIEQDRRFAQDEEARKNAMRLVEAQDGKDHDNDGLIAGQKPEDFKQKSKQEQIDAANDDPNNPLSASNMTAFTQATGGNAYQVRDWAQANGKPLTMEVLNKVKAKFQDYVSRRSDKSKKVDFGEWFKAELAVYGGGWNPASSLWGIL